MKILLTGNRGLVGSQVQADFETQGHTVAGFDLADGHHILDPAALTQAADGCDAVVHAAVPPPPARPG